MTVAQCEVKELRTTKKKVGNQDGNQDRKAVKNDDVITIIIIHVCQFGQDKNFCKMYALPLGPTQPSIQ